MESVGPTGMSSAQLCVLVIPAGVAEFPVSVSVGSRGISTHSSWPEPTEAGSLASQFVSAAALAAPASILDASGTLGVSTWEDTPFTVGSAESSISVSPA